MGGTAALIPTIFSTVTGMAQNQTKGSSNLDKERAAREAEQEQQETEDRKRDRAKVQEARQLEEKRKRRSLLSQGAASLVEEPEVNQAGLKKLLGE